MERATWPDFADDPGLLGRVSELFESVWPGFAPRLHAGREWGLDWTASRPFAVQGAGVAIAHAGVLDVPFVVDGAPFRAAGVHAVCVRREHRGHGLGRRVLEAANAWCDAHDYGTSVLYTDHPELYRKFGFRPVVEHRWVGAIPRARTAPPARVLERTRPEDVALLGRLLRTRTPVSHVVGVVTELPIFLFDEALRPLVHLPDHDAVISARLDEDAGTLVLYDVVAERLPRLGEIAAALDPDARARALAVYFTPDRFAWTGTPEPCRIDDDVLWVRGPFPLEHRPFAIPRSARC